MPRSVHREEALRLKFGGGVHSRASEEDLDPRECSAGQNFALDRDNAQFRPRKGFESLGTLPNSGEVRGFASLFKSDGTISTLVQGAGNVYEWDGGSTFTLVGTVNANAKIRGRLEHNWQLTDKVLITDVNLAEVVYEWDGSTLAAVTFTDETGSGAFGTFRARYCFVENERAVFANIHDNGNDFPHLIVGSARGDYAQITVANRPSSSLSESDPFFLVQPDNRAINGLVESFGRVVVSSKLGNLYKLTGASAKDFAMELLSTRTGAAGDEAMALAVNDIVYGRQGAVESATATERFGDVEQNDLSGPVADLFEGFDDWIIVENRRLNRVYCHPVGGSQIWVLHTGLLESGISPWSQWVTNHAMALNPTAMMNVLDPSDGLEYVLMGDANGNVYRLEGSGTSDAGATITASRTSALFSAEVLAKAVDMEGYLRYRRQEAVNVEVVLLFAGEHPITESVTLALPGTDIDTVYSGDVYYGGDFYYGVDTSKLIRRQFAVPAGSQDFQVKITVDSGNAWTVNELGLRFTQAA